MPGKKALAAILSALLALVAIIAVEEHRLTHLRQELVTEALLSDWQAAHLFIQFTNGQSYWFVDASNPAQVNWAKRLKPLLLITAEDGRILEQSSLYRSLRLPALAATTSSPHIWSVGKQYVFCTGPMQEPDGRTYQLTIGRRL